MMLPIVGRRPGLNWALAFEKIEKPRITPRRLVVKPYTGSYIPEHGKYKQGRFHSPTLTLCLRLTFYIADVSLGRGRSPRDVVSFPSVLEGEVFL